jgi:hypothetical protein
MTTDWKKIATDAWSAPSWLDAAEQYDRDRSGRPLMVETDREQLKRLRRLMSDVSLESTWVEVNRLACERYSEAPKAIYDAVVYELRTHGLPQLKKQNCQRRLSDLSAAQLKAVMVSLQTRRNWYPEITDELLTALAEIYSTGITSHAHQ